MHTYIYIYMCVCVYMAMCRTHMYIYNIHTLEKQILNMHKSAQLGNSGRNP